MHLAAREGHLDYLHFLLQTYDMDIDMIMNDYWTPLFYASLNNHIGVIEFWIKQNSDVNHVDKFLRSALHWATKSRAPDAVKLLLNKGTKWDLKDIEGKTPEDMNQGYEEITKIYVDFDTQRKLKIKKQMRDMRLAENSRMKV